MNIAYEVMGDGPTLVLTHGWLMNRRVWDRQRTLADDFRLVLWDLPQHGSSSQAPDRCHLDDYADALHQLISELDLKEATYVGWSLGMSVFWRTLARYGRGPFHRVVNVEMVPKMDPKQTMVEAVERAMHRDREHATRKFIRQIFHRPKKAELDDMVEMACQVPLNAALQIYRDMSRADFRKVSSQYLGERHVILGRHGFYKDREDFVRSFFSKDPILWFEQSGHAPFWEEAEKFNDFLRENMLTGPEAA